MNKEGHIDLEKISISIETLSSIENVVNLVDLSDNFEDIEKCFRQLNFEHSNCLKYKDSLSTIYADLELIKRKINELVEALKRTKLNYTKINSFSDKDIKEFTEIYKATPASEDLSKLVGTDNTFSLSDLAAKLPTQDDSNVTTVPLPETTPEPTKEPVDTVPIGIAIGATGIAGSIGAVIVDDIYSKREKYHKVKSEEVYLEDYKDDEEILEEEPHKKSSSKSSGIAQGPYRAVRLDRESDHYYGNQFDSMKLDDEYEYFDEDDDYDDDDE